MEFSDYNIEYNLMTNRLAISTNQAYNDTLQTGMPEIFSPNFKLNFQPSDYKLNTINLKTPLFDFSQFKFQMPILDFSQFRLQTQTPNFLGFNMFKPTFNNPSLTSTHNNFGGDVFVSNSQTHKTENEFHRQITTTSSNIPHWTKMSDSDMKNTYGNYDFDITKTFKGTADDLNKFLNKYPKLANKGNVFIQAQQKYGINALALIAIFGQETSYGTNGRAKDINNLANIEKPKNASYSGRWRRFNSVDDCIMELARLLKENYVDNSGKAGIHLTKLYQIFSVRQADSLHCF